MQKLKHLVTNDFGRKLFEAAKSMIMSGAPSITAHKFGLCNKTIALAFVLAGLLKLVKSLRQGLKAAADTNQYQKRLIMLTALLNY